MNGTVMDVTQHYQSSYEDIVIMLSFVLAFALGIAAFIMYEYRKFKRLNNN